MSSKAILNLKIALLVFSKHSSAELALDFNTNVNAKTDKISFIFFIIKNIISDIYNFILYSI